MKFTITNIRVEEDILKELKLKAVHEGRRVAELVREAIREFLGKTKEGTAVKGRHDPLFSLVGLCKTGIKDDSENLDSLLYGQKKKAGKK